MPRCCGFRDGSKNAGVAFLAQLAFLRSLCSAKRNGHIAGLGHIRTPRPGTGWVPRWRDGERECERRRGQRESTSEHLAGSTVQWNGHGRRDKPASLCTLAVARSPVGWVGAWLKACAPKA